MMSTHDRLKMMSRPQTPVTALILMQMQMRMQVLLRRG